jgi:PilZ domain
VPPISTYDFFLVFPAAAYRMNQLCGVGLEALARLVGVDLYYRAETDLALLALRLDARTATHTLLERLRDEAETAGAAVLEPARLDEEERERFYGDHLVSYPLRVENFPTVADAVRKLAHDLGVEARFAAGEQGGGPRRIEVRIRRGEEWMLGRARSLTREGLYVYSGCALREGDPVELQLTAEDTTMTLRAEVVHVTYEDPALTVGGAGFGARFLLATPEERQQLETLVASGRVEGLGTLRSAPARREARYPVRWPVAIETPVGRAHVSALDVSRSGMFVAMATSLTTSHVSLHVPPDEVGHLITARGRVARQMSGRVAERRGVTAGYGIEIEGFEAGDEKRFHVFVDRVGQRAGRHVVVGANVERARELVSSLVAAGYVATGLSDPAAILRRAPATRPDLVLIDPTLTATERGARTLTRRLAARSTLSYQLDANQDERSVRDLADAALLS